jgi:restriction system protein
LIPDYQTLMLPVLKLAASGEVSISDAVESVSKEFALTTSELTEMLPSGRLSVIRSRVHWAKAYLKQAGLVEATKRGHFRITLNGQVLLGENPAKIDNNLLRRFPEFRSFLARGKAEAGGGPTIMAVPNEATPEEVLQDAYQQITRSVAQELIDRLRAGSPAFFERAIVTLLIEMGYGGSSEDAGRAIGQSGDDGVDGVIDQDPLGVDQIYVQAKRYAEGNAVGPAAIREFFGSLSLKKAQKGIFVSTSGFSKSAIDTARQIGARIVLIDADQLGRLMVRHNVGCRDQEVLHIKRVDEDFFE